MKEFSDYLAKLPKTPLVEAVQSLYESSWCEAIESRVSGTAWDDVERIHVYHAADPSMDMDIKLDSLWATRQKDSATRQDVIDRFVEDAEDFNKWLATSEDCGAFITTASIKFKGAPNEVTVKIPCPGDGQSTDSNTYENNLYESVDNSKAVFRKPSAEELSEFVSAASETEHRMRSDWDSSREAIVNEDKEFIKQVSNGTFQAVTDGNGIVIYGEADGRMYIYLLFVRPECRRTGTAQRLMEYVKTQAKGMPVALSVNNHNKAARALYKKLGMADSKTFGYDGYDIIEMQSPLTESVEPMTFKTIEELRDYLDRAAYGTFENSEYDQYEQEPYGSLENIQEVDMADFVKDMLGMNHDIQSLVGQPIDDKTLNQLVYDWFVCLHTRGAVGWQYNWN